MCPGRRRRPPFGAQRPARAGCRITGTLGVVCAGQKLENGAGRPHAGAIVWAGGAISSGFAAPVASSVFDTPAGGRGGSSRPTRAAGRAGWALRAVKVSRRAHGPLLHESPRSRQAPLTRFPPKPKPFRFFSVYENLITCFLSMCLPPRATAEAGLRRWLSLPTHSLTAASSLRLASAN